MAWLRRPRDRRCVSDLCVFFPVAGRSLSSTSPHWLWVFFCRWEASEGLRHWYLWDQKSMLTYWIYPPWLMMFCPPGPGRAFQSAEPSKWRGKKKIRPTRHCHVIKSQRCLNRGTLPTSQRFSLKFLSSQFILPICVRNSYQMASIDFKLTSIRSVVSLNI